MRMKLGLKSATFSYLCRNVITNLMNNHMKRRLFALPLLAMFSMSLSCCSDDEEASGGTYYIKYEMSASSIYSRVKKTITVQTDEGVKEYNTISNTWEATFGPVSKPFTAFCNCTLTNDEGYVWDNTNLHCRIYVSRNAEPFVIKAEDSGSKPITLSYKIDF